MKKIKALVLILVLPVFLIGCSHFTETDFGHYSKAETFYTKGDFRKAIAEYGEYLKLEPQGNMAIIAHYYTAKSQAALGNTGAAKTGYENVIKKYPASDWASFSKKQIEDLETAKKS